MNMKTTEQRINNIIGQLEGVKKMACDKQRDCFSVLIQMKAIKSAIASLMEKTIATELDHCLVSEKASNKDKLEKIFKEIIKK